MLHFLTTPHDGVTTITSALCRHRMAPGEGLEETSCVALRWRRRRSRYWRLSGGSRVAIFPQRWADSASRLPPRPSALCYSSRLVCSIPSSPTHFTHSACDWTRPDDRRRSPVIPLRCWAPFMDDTAYQSERSAAIRLNGRERRAPHSSATSPLTAMSSAIRWRFPLLLLVVSASSVACRPAAGETPSDAAEPLSVADGYIHFSVANDSQFREKSRKAFESLISEPRRQQFSSQEIIFRPHADVGDALEKKERKPGTSRKLAFDQCLAAFKDNDSNNTCAISNSSRSTVSIRPRYSYWFNRQASESSF